MLLPTRDLVTRMSAAAAVVVLLAAGSTGVAPARGSDEVGRRGDLLGALPMVARVAPLVPYRARAWHVRYRSSGARGEFTTVTGTVLVPRSPWRGDGRRPIVGFAVGTHGLADRCRPSLQLTRGTEYEAAAISGFLDQGWAVAVTDYPGLGTPDNHPFVVGRVLGRAVLDSVRAAQQLLGLPRRGPVLLYGYSEGGNAVGWALQLAASYAPELNVRGGFVGAAPADLFGMVRHHDGRATGFLILYAASGFDAAYPGLHLERSLNDRGRRAVAALRDSCVWDAPARALLRPTHYRAYVDGDPLQRPDWRRRLRQNAIGHRSTGVPVLLGAVRRDEIVPYAQETGLYRRWCARGVNVHLRTIDATDHFSGGIAFVPVGIGFLRDRLAGVPLPRPADC